MSLVILAVFAADVIDASARARSGGSRGSRSFSSPTQPMSPSSPSSPSRSFSQPAPVAPQRPGGMFGGGLMGGLAGFAIGGLIGSMLFGGMGHGLGGFGGIGLIEILLIGGGLYLLFRFMKTRREAQQPAYAASGAQYGGRMPDADAAPGTGIGGTATMEMPAGISDLDRGISHIRQMDSAFDPMVASQLGREVFTSVQNAVMAHNMAPVAGRLTSRMYTELQDQCDRLRSARQTNRLEQIDVRRAELSEAWQEGGQDYVTVYLEGTLLDYTVDDNTGNVVEGSRTTPESFSEFWTFVRPVGPGPWKLSAIQTG